MKRLIKLVCAVALVGGAWSGTASAGGFNDSACNPHIGSQGYEECYPAPGTVGSFYSWSLPTHGGCPPFTFRVADGTPPPGLSVESHNSVGEIRGTPTKEGTYRFNIAYTSSTPTCLGDYNDRYFNITILPAPLAIQTGSLKPAIVGTAYSQQLSSTRDATWSIASGTLPAGLSLTANGTISGTPTTPGDVTFTVAATGNGQTATKQLSIKVVAPLKLTAAAPKAAEVGVRFKATIAASGGIPAYTWTIGALPAGLTFDQAAGIVSGTPTAAGTYLVKVTLADTNGSATELNLKLRIAAHLTIATTKLKAAKAGGAYALKLAASGGVRPLKWRLIGRLPAGLRLDPKAGAIVGTAKKAGKAHFSVRARDSLGAVATTAYTLSVSA